MENALLVCTIYNMIIIYTYSICYVLEPRQLWSIVGIPTMAKIIAENGKTCCSNIRRMMEGKVKQEARFYLRSK